MPSGDIPALLPLSVLEAMRNLDTPLDDGLGEPQAGDMLNRRLGLSDTVQAQAARYLEATRQRGTIPRVEALQVFRLAGRRPDRGLLFADAGRRAARYAVRTAPKARLRAVLPPPMRRGAARRLAQRLAREVFDCDLRWEGREATFTSLQPFGIEALPDGGACALHTAGLAELLRLLTGFEGATLQTRCRAEGSDACAWHAHQPAALYAE